MSNKILLKKVGNSFLQGLLFTLPIVATIFVIYKIFVLLDSIMPVGIPGLGIIIIFSIITIIGYLSRFYFANPASIFVRKRLEKTPLINLVYTSVKDLVGAFVGEKKSFSVPVLITLSFQPLTQRVGFITQNDLTNLGIGANMVAVYLPFSYGVNGELLIVDRANVQAITAAGSDMMKFVISGGVAEVHNADDLDDM